MQIGVQFDSDVGVYQNGFGKTATDARAQAAIRTMREYVIRACFDCPGPRIVARPVVDYDDFKSPSQGFDFWGNRAHPIDCAFIDSCSLYAGIITARQNGADMPSTDDSGLVTTCIALSWRS